MGAVNEKAYYKDLDPWSCSVGKTTVENESCDMRVDRMIPLFQITAIMITGGCKDRSHQFYVKFQKNLLNLQITNTGHLFEVLKFIYTKSGNCF